MSPAGKKYYEGGYRAIIDGVPIRLAYKPSAHVLAIMNGQSNTKLLRELESARHAETTYGPVADGWYCITARTKKESDQFFIVVNGARQPELFSNWRKASDALVDALVKAKAVRS